MNKQPKKKRGRPAVKKSAQKRTYKKNYSSTVELSNGGDNSDYFVGEVKTIVFAGREIIHPAYELAEKHAESLQPGQGFIMTKKFRSALRNYLLDQFETRKYGFNSVVGNDKVVQVSRKL